MIVPDETGPIILAPWCQMEDMRHEKGENELCAVLLVVAQNRGMNLGLLSYGVIFTVRRVNMSFVLCCCCWLKIEG